MRRTFNGGEPLHRTRIGKTKSSHSSIRPWLAGSPLDSVVTIPSLVFVRAKLSLGLKSAANILNYDRIAAIDCVLESRVLLLRCIFPIGRAIDEHRKFSVFTRPQHVRPQNYTVAHRYRDVLTQ